MDLLHIRVGPKIKKKIQSLVDQGLFSNNAEVSREGIRNIILKYDKRKKKVRQKE